VAQVADYPLPQLLMAIDQLERHAVIRPSTSVGNEMGYDFAHDIVRQAVYRQLSEPRRRLLHYQIAQTLHQNFAVDDAVAADVAHHAALGSDFLLATASSLTAAQRSLKLFAYAEAAELAQRGMDYCQQLDDRSRIQFHAKLLKVFVFAGVPKNRVAQLEAKLHQLIAESNRLGLQDEEAIALEALIALNFDHGNITGVHEHSLRASERGRAASPTITARILAYTGWCLAEIERDMPRAEALLLEAQSLAARVGQELMDVQSGLGIVRYYEADRESARLLLEQAWRMAQALQDHWRECICLKYLAMLELEAGEAEASLVYSRAMAIVADQMGETNTESAIAAALTLLVQYRANPIRHHALLEQVLSTLNQLDDQRLRAYTLTYAAETDLQYQRIDLAITRAQAALTAARVVDHASCIALAWVAWVRGLLASGELQQAIATFNALRQQIRDRAISVRAHTALQQLELQIGEGEMHGSSPG
jgi:predicted ATPase